MSEVFSFRLDEHNSREKQALDILQKRSRQGFSIRQTIVEALIGLGEASNDEKATKDVLSIQRSIERLINLFSEQNEKSNPDRNVALKNSNEELPSSFISSLKSVAKPGIRM